MFCGLLRGGNFSKKCKQALKLINMRIEHIKRKKQAVVCILKKDIADLSAGGQKAVAFKRMDALIVEMNLASCYEMIEGFCDCIMNQLPILQKTKDCPEEAMEAVSTLIFAAARFPDLPELCKLRSLFAKRYGNCMESSVNPQFAEKTRNKTFSKQKKLELMENIAGEFDRPTEKEINGYNLASVESVPNEIHVISTIKTSDDSCDPKDIEACENAKISTEEQHEMDCIPVDKEVISVKTSNAYVTNRRVPNLDEEIDNEEMHVGSDETGLKNQLEKELNQNRRGRYLNPPYRIQLKIHDTSNGVELHIEKPMLLSLDHAATKDEEEMALDKLLQHYSRKGTDTEATELDDGGAVKKVPPPQRTFSLPHESRSPSEAKTHVRGKSLHSDPLSPKRGRVHPRLPDYDQLAARFAALKNGRGATIPHMNVCI
ncbi:uncharacterized protein LOC122002091 [Zingiber officinale]|uniref:IST1-like protein n=1 Tax=Zingiber officinale TaxID=94328 RepID=A0A8J5KS84_ZINOF|nr:uncharacterized protein LOC122002091 [Zingiber officinale]KAG6493457.1 hypothetical protein ZIOFF_048443 [Zingiber officinale]